MKHAKTLVAAITLLTAVRANANENPIIKNVEQAKDFAVNNKVSEFVVNEYKDIKKFQQQSWQQGKDQLGKNKEQLVGIYTNVKDAFKFYFMKENQSEAN